MGSKNIFVEKIKNMFILELRLFLKQFLGLIIYEKNSQVLQIGVKFARYYSDVIFWSIF
jgi:hypothetical protein